mgnify:CR=1 FL=1
MQTSTTVSLKLVFDINRRWLYSKQQSTFVLIIVTLFTHALCFRNIAMLSDVDSRILHSSMMVLQLLLSSPKTVLRFGAVRALNSIAARNPATVALCNVELESLVADDNRSILTAAVTTLLRTGSEDSVDRLMLQVSSLFTGLQVNKPFVGMIIF